MCIRYIVSKEISLTIMERSILFLSVPAFPIAVERVISSRLIDRPIALVQSANSRTRCLVISSEARQAGIRRGMPLKIAQRCCRDLEVVHPDIPLYRRAAKAIQMRLDEYSPLIEPGKYGQFYIDMTGCGRLFGNPRSVIENIRKQLGNDLRLPAIGGLATNKLVSRIASLNSLPEGVLQVDTGGEKSFMSPHSARILPATNRIIRRSMSELNVRLVQDVRDLKIEYLLRAFGRRGMVLSRQADGVDPTPVISPETPPQVQRIEEFPEDSNDRHYIRAMLKQMIIDGHSELYQKRSSAREMVLTIYYTDGYVDSNRHRFRVQNESGTVWLAVGEELIVKTLTRRVRVRRLELVFTQLGHDCKQLDLFNSALIDPSFQKRDGHLGDQYDPVHNKLDRVLQVMDDIRNRFGNGMATLGGGLQCSST